MIPSIAAPRVGSLRNPNPLQVTALSRGRKEAPEKWESAAEYDYKKGSGGKGSKKPDESNIT